MNAVLRGLQATDARSLFFVALGVLLLAMTPHGILSGNEEQYLAEAFRTVRPDAWPAASNLLGGFPHAFVFNHAMGTLVDVLGFPVAQAVGRGAAILLYAFGLVRLFRLFQLNTMMAAVVLCAYLVLGESLIGNEWLFRGVEPKVFAYGLVLLALVEAVRARPPACFALLVAATYVHAFVGGFWAVILAIMLLTDPRIRARVVVAGAAATVAVMPYVVFLSRTGYAQFVPGEAAPSGPSVGWILSYVAYPWHVMPFLDTRSLVQWAPGILGTVLAAVVSAMFWRRAADDRLRRLALVALLASAWVLLVLVLTAWLDDGRLGPYVLFRPSGLGLLLVLLLCVASMRALRIRRALWLSVGLLAGLVPAVVPVLQQTYLYPAARDVLRARQQVALVEWIAGRTAPDSVFLVEPALEEQFFELERRTQRASLFVHRFTPGRAADIREWYRRYQYREYVFDKGCAGAASPARADYLIVTTQTAQRIAMSCGRVVFESSGYSVLALGPAPNNPAECRA